MIEKTCDLCGKKIEAYNDDQMDHLMGEHRNSTPCFKAQKVKE